MIRPSAGLALACGLAAALAAGAAAADQVTNAGGALAPAEAAAGQADKLISHDQAAANYPTTASAAATSEDGIREPVDANTAPGSDRLAMDNEPDKLVRSDGEVRLNPLIGHALFSSSGRNLGTIKDVLIGRHGEPQMVVEAPGHLVAVPWSKLYFGLPGSQLHGHAVLPSTTEHELSELPAFSLTERNG